MTTQKRYTTGEFSKRANISVRSIRYYDQKGILTPSFVAESGYRYYTDYDFIRLQQIIVLKRLGFSLDDIKSITKNERNQNYIAESFRIQRDLIHNKILELQVIENMLSEASETITQKAEPDWNQLISLIHLLNMEESLSKQFENAKNINARIALHKRFSAHTTGWFRWIYHNLPIKSKMKVLELGCGNGQMWVDNLASLPPDIHITLSDISSGMLMSAKSALGNHSCFTYQSFDFHQIPYDSESFDLVVANFVLFYAKDRKKVYHEVLRILTNHGYFSCATYGKSHMKEIEALVKEFDERISLSEIKLYDIFGLENAKDELQNYFDEVTMLRYEDSLNITEAEPLLDYIYSCHGNQMDYLSDKKDAFESFVRKKIPKKGFPVTKDCGMFLCRKS